ncbi:MAG: hypothetical protein WDN49_24020 [Acetobacteraceae bacterium]
MIQAESLVQLAALIEIDPDVLARTVGEYNAAVGRRVRSGFRTPAPGA